MKHHWIIYEGRDTVTYEQVNYIPQPHSSNVLAEEIDGMGRSQAIQTLENMYEEVTTIKGSNRIFCKRRKQ